MTNKGTPEKKERNLELYEDHKTGKFSTVDLVAKYRISSARVYQILKQLNKKSEPKTPIDNPLE